jgi:tetratricopeptide (TPR) repeat protein
MQSSIKQTALAGCVSLMVGGCAVHQNAAPEYRLSTSAPEVIPYSSMLQRGRAQLDAGLDALAIESFRAELRQNPDSADAFNGLAVAYGCIGRDDLAQRYFETALAKDPANVRAQTNLAKLTGGEVPAVQLAAIETAIDRFEPVALTALDNAEPASRLVDNFESPALAAVQMPALINADIDAPEILAKQGVLSARFAIAPAGLTVMKASQSRASFPARDVPDQPPVQPSPTLPTASLPVEYRSSGARLERVSLGEVRLITQPVVPAPLPLKKQGFESFGDRLAVWLPESVAAEQVGNNHGVIESAVIMAAIERAEQGQKLARANDGFDKKLPEFAYLFFNYNSDIASA